MVGRSNYSVCADGHLLGSTRLDKQTVKPFDYGSLAGEFALGIVLAATILALPILILTPSESLGAWIPIFFSFFGTLLGATIGTTTSIWLANKQRENYRRSQFFFALATCQEIYSNIAQFQKWIEEAIVETTKLGFTDFDNKWQVVQPLAGLPTPIKIQPETIAVLFEVKEYDLAHDLGQLSRQHDSVREVVQTYATLRTELRSLMKVAPPAKDDIPGKFASFLSPEEAASLRPRFAELESIINGLRELLPGYNDAGKKVLAEFKPAAKRRFKNQLFPGIEFK